MVFELFTVGGKLSVLVEMVSEFRFGEVHECLFLPYLVYVVYLSVFVCVKIVMDSIFEW